METGTQCVGGAGEGAGERRGTTDTVDEFTVVVTECPKCERSQSVRVRNTIDATAEPALKEALLARTSMAHVCVGCGAEYQLAYDFLYVDSERDFAIVLSQAAHARGLADRVPTHPGPRRRLVGSWAQLVEKILVFDAELDDRVVELVKLAVCRQLIDRYADSLATLGMLPLDVSRVSFRRIGPGATGDATIELLVRASPNRLPMTVRAPFAAFARDAQARLAQLDAEQTMLSNTSDWPVVDQNWATRVLGGMDRIPLTSEKLELLYGPRPTTDPVTSAYFKTGPIVPSGSRRAIHLPNPASRAWRPQHYRFSHERLRVAFDDPEEWIDALHSSERHALVNALWDEVTRALRSEGKPTPLRAEGIKVHTGRIQAYPTVIVEMMPPTGWCEAYFVALVLRRIGVGGGSISEAPMLAFYTLELGQREDDSPCTCFCEWKADGSHRNHGFGPAPTLDDFVEVVTAHVRATSIVKAPLPPEVVRDRPR